ncbi:AraC family ligand binding domain-containing protein [Lysinibacillus agricola]|uniref:AraC family ligand binding domain-containing protein n=1 Tax=Lysinibacillus agricola TaxID=2590012 RepID=A0ABX7ANN5_9BACI|nr:MULTISPECIES: AraC family ligand binding domain-containing protein [Lysinibacillus]KOS62253.1 cupin [Lysinibacillus sp. FJAT-14222]QQP10518.1 AraC family ligand binding domain-containing protein [Lysinibacillus agricola]
MKLYQLSKENGKNITQFESNFIMSRIINTEASASIGCMYLEENGVIGYHQAVVPQLLLILEGKGYVRNEQEQYYQVQPGDAVFWEKDEWHETKTDKGLTGIVIESEQLNPAAFMPLK